MYRVCGKHKITGEVRRGKAIYAKQVAQILADDLDAIFPLIEHWIEE